MKKILLLIALLAFVSSFAGDGIDYSDLWDQPGVAVLECAGFSSKAECEQYMQDNPPLYVNTDVVSDCVVDSNCTQTNHFDDNWREKAARRRLDNLANKARLGR